MIKKAGNLTMFVVAMGYLATGGLMFGSRHAYAAVTPFSGEVQNTKGTTNHVSVGADGKPVITPTKLGDGTYTTDLDPTALASFMTTNSSLQLTCNVPHRSGFGSGGGGGGSSSRDNGGYDTDGDGLADSRTRAHGTDPRYSTCSGCDGSGNSDGTPESLSP